MPSFQCPRPDLTDRLLKHVRYLVEERRKLGATGTRLSSSPPQRLDYLSLMLEAADGGKLSDAEIEWNSYVFLMAGYETTASTLSAIAYCLGTHAHVQERLYRELQTSSMDDVETLMKLPYLEQVMKEAARLYGPAAYVDFPLREMGWERG